MFSGVVSPPAGNVTMDLDSAGLPILDSPAPVNPASTAAPVVSSPVTTTPPVMSPHLVSHPSLEVLSLRILMPFNCIICISTECQRALEPSSAPAHLHTVHDIPLTTTQKEGLNKLFAELDVARVPTDMEIPRDIPVELPGLKVISGFGCNYCTYCAGAEGTMRNHWQDMHRDREGTFHKGAYHKGFIQFFFKSAQKYFEVRKASTMDIDNPFHLYHSQNPTLFDVRPRVYVTPSQKEIPPLLCVTQWHEHLANVIRSPDKVRRVRSVMQLPCQNATDWTSRVNPLVMLYLQVTWDQANASSLGVRRNLMMSPLSPSQKSFDLFRPLDDPSLKHYGLLLVKFTLAVLRSLDDKEMVKRFSLSTEDIDRGREFLSVLIKNEGNIDYFHKFMKPFLYPREIEDTGKAVSKWSNPLECLIAVYELEEDGIFKQPEDVTQIYAQLSYHIRCVTLYEANRKVNGYGNNVLR